MLKALSLTGVTMLCGCGLISFPVTTDPETSTVDGQALCPDVDIVSVLPDALAQPVKDLVALLVQGAFDSLGSEITSEIEARDTGPVSKITMKSVTLEQDPTPAGATVTNSMGFMSALTVHLEAVGEFPAIEVAWADDIPEDATIIEMTVDDSIDINPYIEQGAEVRVTPSLRTCPREDVRITTTMRVLVFI